LGIIGAGQIAQEHLKVIQAMNGVVVDGITSRTKLKAEELAKTYAIKQVYDNIDDLVEKYAPDGLMILVSANQIFDVTKKLIPTNIPLFIEKPPGLTTEQTTILAEIADKNRTKNMVGYNRRYYSIFHKGLKIVKEHGKLLGVAVEGHERFWTIAKKINEKVRPYWIYANSTHTIDLLRFFGGEPSSVHALKHSHVEKNGDQFATVIEFQSGALGNYISHWYSPGGWSVRLFGEGVTVEYKPLERGVWIDTNFNYHEIVPDEVDLNYKPGFYRQMEAFGKIIRAGKIEWPGQDLSSGLKTMLLAKKIAEG
jgi:predicted dehydrogenase